MKKTVIFVLMLLMLISLTANASQVINADYYFYSPCTDCGAEQSAEIELRAKLENAYPESEINTDIHNVADENEKALLEKELSERGQDLALSETYPIVFIGDRVLIGEQYHSAFEKSEKGVTVTELILTALSGFTGGISPCSLSLILMLLAQLAVNKKRALVSGLSFIAGRAVIYLLLGTVLSEILNAVNTAALSQIVYALTVVTCIVFAVLCFADFIIISRGHAGRAILKLPRKMKSFYENTVEKTVFSKTVTVTAFISGLFVGIGEFFCTGQIFAVTVLNNFDKDAYRWLIFSLYAIMMSVPAVAVTLLIYKGKSYLAIAKFLSGKEQAVKLALSVLFVLFGVFCVWKIYF